MNLRILIFAPIYVAWLVSSAGLVAAQGSDNADASAEAVEEITVTGIRTGVLKHEATTFSNVLYTEDFDAENKSLADLLSESEGVFVRRFGGAGDRSEVSIRGSSPSQVVVSIDGIRANSALNGGLNLSRICLPLVESVEISRGAGATWQGSGAIGGTVNVNTRNTTDEPVNRVGFSAGAFDTYEGSIFRAASAGELDYSLGYCGFATEGDFGFARPVFIGPDGIPSSFIPDEAERINNDRVQHGASLGLGVPLGPGELRFSDYFVHSRGGEPGIDCCNGETAGQNLEARSADWNNLAQLRWDAESVGGLDGDLGLTIFHRYDALDFEDPLRLFEDPIDLSAHVSTFGARVVDRWQTGFGPGRHEPGLQLDFSDDRFTSSDQSNRSRTMSAVTIDDSSRFFDDRLLVSAALRADWTEGFGWNWIPSLGLAITPLRWLRIRGNVGRAFRIPSIEELYLPDQGFIRGNADLVAEDAVNADAGLELLLAQLGPLSSLRLTAGYFWRSIENSIVWVRINDTTIQPVNTGEATAQGIELSLALRLTDYLRVSIHDTELDSSRDATGRRLPGQPERETFARLQIGPDQAWKLVGEVQHTGDILVSEGGGRHLPARTVWNASAALNLAATRWPGVPEPITHLWLFAEINNIGDIAVRDALTFPQPGRHASAGFEVNW